jgi:hypothetical protein
MPWQRLKQSPLKTAQLNAVYSGDPRLEHLSCCWFLEIGQENGKKKSKHSFDYAALDHKHEEVVTGWHCCFNHDISTLPESARTNCSLQLQFAGGCPQATRC